jgi:hypothetical protein
MENLTDDFNPEAGIEENKIKIKSIVCSMISKNIRQFQ